MDYQAKLQTPFGMLGIRCEAEALTGIEFLAPGAASQPPRDTFAQKVCQQLAAYFTDPDFHFDLPIKLNGTAHSSKVWQAMGAIPRGQTRSYGDLAAQLRSSPRAVGQACGANPVPIIIPCHRVVSKSGTGGFMHQRGGSALDIKRWLLAHESATPSPLMGALKVRNPLRDKSRVELSEGSGITNDLPSVFCWVSQMASSSIRG